MPRCIESYFELESNESFGQHLTLDLTATSCSNRQATSWNNKKYGSPEITTVGSPSPQRTKQFDMSSFSAIPLGTYDARPQKGFTSTLLDTIAASKSKIEEWAKYEKAKADKAAEDYRQKLMKEQAQIDSKATDLLAIQLDRGLTVKSNPEENDTAESVAQKLNSLEEQQGFLESEIEKLKEEYQSREKRVKGNFSIVIMSIWAFA